MSNGQNQIPITISSTTSSRLNTYGSNNSNSNSNSNNIGNVNNLNNAASSKSLNIQLINNKDAANNKPVSGSSAISESTINIINGSTSGAGLSGARNPMQNVSLENANNLNVPIQNELEYVDLEDLDKIITNERNNLSFETASNSNEQHNDENRNNNNSIVSINGNMGKSKSTHYHKHRYETLLLKELMQLSIKREKIEKALAATGYQRSIDAINWLMKHSKDPVLLHDSIISTRDFILLLCPVGRLASQIDTFLQQSKFKCGTNEAHFNNSLPYMKLSPFFKVNEK
jgi:hypothetical protein